MASEVLAATTSPIILNGSTSFAAAGLVHTSRVITFDAIGLLFAQKSGGRFYNDECTIDYSISGGTSWTPLDTFQGADGGYRVAVSYTINASVLVAISDIKVRIRTSLQVPTESEPVTLENIILTGSDAGLPATVPHCQCDMFGF